MNAGRRKVRIHISEILAHFHGFSKALGLCGSDEGGGERGSELKQTKAKIRSTKSANVLV